MKLTYLGRIDFEDFDFPVRQSLFQDVVKAGQVGIVDEVLSKHFLFASLRLTLWLGGVEGNDLLLGTSNLPLQVFEQLEWVDPRRNVLMTRSGALWVKAHKYYSHR